LAAPYTWNLVLEQQLGSNRLLSLGYFGDVDYHLSSNAIGRRQLNPAMYIPGQSMQATHRRAASTQTSAASASITPILIPDLQSVRLGQFHRGPA